MASRSMKLVNLEWLEGNVPCSQACPVRTQAGRYCAMIAEGRFEAAYAVAEEPNPLAAICGHVCAAPCEAACRRGRIDQPVAIRALKRFVAEQFGPYSKLGRQRIVSTMRTPKKLSGPKIAVLGAGPAGLSAATDLAKLGYRVIIFEAAPVAGGMLALGIPEYRLPRYIVQAQVDWVLSLGVELKVNHRLGRDFWLRHLWEQDYSAVFLAIGAHRSRELRIEGVHLDGVLQGVDFLLNANLNYRVDLGRKVVVVGGGNVAVDVARSVLRFNEDEYVEPDRYLHSALDAARFALRMGAREVSLVCLESREEMPAFQDEVEEAQHEGIVIHSSLGPKRIVGEEGRVCGLETIAVKSVFDALGRFNPEFHPNSEETMPAETIILAIGQTSDLTFIEPEDGLDVTPRGTLEVDPVTLATSDPRVFAGGDVAFGARNVIEAVADGRRAAASIHQFLSGMAPARPRSVKIAVFPPHAWKRDPIYESCSRVKVPTLPIDRRIGVAEIDLGYSEQQALREANRCLQCWVNTIFEGTEETSSECILCAGCVDVCPEDCLALGPADWLAGDGQLRQELENEFRAELGADGEQIAAVLIKNEDRCIRCGLCEQRCPVGCITMESFLVESGVLVA
ncbi:MAG: FAD-dependent oxidoreductase [Candidatus Solibacter usitatus]|nr:FAD-dependent oxidoreductase [Candidatus Solibacter usitatus]